MAAQIKEANDELLAKPDGQPYLDGSDMLMMHNIFRRELALAGDRTYQLLADVAVAV